MISVLLPSTEVLDICVTKVPTVIDLKLHVNRREGVPIGMQKVHQINGPLWDLFQNDALIPSQSYVVLFNSRMFALWECPFNDRLVGCNTYHGYEWGTDCVFLKDLAMYCINKGFNCLYDFFSYLRGKPCTPRVTALLNKRADLSEFDSRKGWVFRSVADDHLMLKRWWLIDTDSTCWHCPYTNHFVLFVPFTVDHSLLLAFEHSFFSSVMDTISDNALDDHPISLTTPFSILDYYDGLKETVAIWMNNTNKKDPQFEMQYERYIHIHRVISSYKFSKRCSATRAPKI